MLSTTNHAIINSVSNKVIKKGKTLNPYTIIENTINDQIRENINLTPLNEQINKIAENALAPQDDNLIALASSHYTTFVHDYYVSIIGVIAFIAVITSISAILAKEATTN